MFFITKHVINASKKPLLFFKPDCHIARTQGGGQSRRISAYNRRRHIHAAPPPSPNITINVLPPVWPPSALSARGMGSSSRNQIRFCRKMQQRPDRRRVRHKYPT